MMQTNFKYSEGKNQSFTWLKKEGCILKLLSTLKSLVPNMCAFCILNFGPADCKIGTRATRLIFTVELPLLISLTKRPRN